MGIKDMQYCEMAVNHHIVLVLAELRQVVERNSIALDSNLFHQVSKLAVGTLSQVGQQTVFELVPVVQHNVIGPGTGQGTACVGCSSVQPRLFY